jgi:4-amino-4-deoxy-L-arabinose transferase-like glycosyltransferase
MGTEPSHPSGRTGAPPGRPQWQELSLLGVILAVAMALRVWNLSWGLPDIFEEATPFMVARSFWGSAGGSITFHPDFFHYPALSFYLQFAVQGVQYLAGMVTGTFPTLDAFRGELASNPGAFMVASRFVSVIFDVATVGLAWMSARTMFGRGTAVGAALLIAFNPLHLSAARGVNVDVLLTFFLMLTLFLTMNLSARAGAGRFILAGAAIGLAASTKYTGALFLLLPAAVLTVEFASSESDAPGARRDMIKHALLVPAFAVVVFSVLNPYVFLDPGAFIRDFTYEQYHMSYGHLGLDTSQTTAGFYFLGTIVPDLGLVFLAGAVAGAVVCLGGKTRVGIGLTLMAVVYIAVISTWTMRAGRYLLPVIPLLSILSAAGCVQAVGRAAATLAGGRWLRSGPRGRFFAGRVLPATAICAAMLVPVSGSFRNIHEAGLTDTRSVAREWIGSNVAPGSVIISGPFGITFPPGRQVVYIPFVATGSEATAPFYDVAWYEDFDLLIASDYDYGRYSREPDRFGELLEFYRDLRSGWSLLAEISPDSLHAGPALWFYTPQRGKRIDAFDPSLLERLATVSDSGLVADFARNLSGALFARGRPGKCSQLLDLGLRLYPDNPALVRSKAFVLYKEGRYAEATELLTGWERGGGESFEMLLLHGNILVESGDPRGAEALFLRARDLRPASTLPYTLLAAMYAGERDTAALIRTLERYRSLASGEGGDAARVGAWLDSLKKIR